MSSPLSIEVCGQVLGIAAAQVCKGAALALLGLAAAGFVLLLVHRTNRLLFWCLLVALSLHIGFAGTLWGIRYLGKRAPEEPRVKIAAFQPALPPEKEPPPPPPPERLDLPLGALSGDRHAKQMPKGTTLETDKVGAPGPKDEGPGRPIVKSISDFGDIPIDEKDEGLFTGTFQDVIDASDIRSLTSGGGGGEGAGTPDGKGSGPVPAGFPQGKIDGRVYFLRLKYGQKSAWNAHSTGTNRLLAFLNQFFPCESEGRAISAAEMRDRYMNKGAYPSFVYIYCDDLLQFTNVEVAVLREYLTQGGFLFLDSRPDLLTKERVARELDKVLPGTPLKDIPKSHPINSFLFTLSSPGVGQNTVTMRNYGITRGDRLVVFFTIGNFSHLFASTPPDAHEYITAQYQMGANVMLYAITRGQSRGITRRQGANATITSQALKSLGLLDSPAKANPAGQETTIKVTRPPAATSGNEATAPAPPDEPDDINMFD